MTKADLHQLVDELPDGSIDGAALLLTRVVKGHLDPDQAWVWTEEWQDQLRASLSELATGLTQRFGSSEDFQASL